MAAITKSNDGKKAAADEQPLGQTESAERRGKAVQAERPQPVDVSSAPAPKSSGPGFFTIYKKGQGYWTRMGTAMGAGLLGAMIAYEIYQQLPVFLPGGDAANTARDKHIAMVVAVVFLVAWAVWAFWFTNKPSTVDFLIATDSEMKKVNWTTRKELIGSTRIVILFMFLIALYLFICDLLFGGFFKLIHVLKTWF